MHFKALSLVSFLILSAAASEDKKELFNDKYLNSQKLNLYRDTNINISSDFKISNIKEMTKISDETNTTTATMIENSIKSNTLENEAQNLKEQIKSKDFQKKINNKNSPHLFEHTLRQMRAVLYIITHLIFRLKLFRLLGTRFESKVLKRHLGPYGSITGRQREEALLRDRERKLY